MARKTLMPWGRNTPLRNKTATISKRRGNSPTPDSSLAGMKYPANKPALWPIEGKKRASATAPTEAAAERHNAIVENAYARDDYYGRKGPNMIGVPYPGTVTADMEHMHVALRVYRDGDRYAKGDYVEYNGKVYRSNSWKYPPQQFNPEEYSSGTPDTPMDTSSWPWTLITDYSVLAPAGG